MFYIRHRILKHVYEACNVLINARVYLNLLKGLGCFQQVKIALIVADGKSDFGERERERNGKDNCVT